ncbi:hypothetical protein [Geobacter sp.]|uniref:hypothetical protein n=1 Tax=Geobacter sp. TaxID=46610 RepID=UPI00262701E2|nr:hypothetical protein [Geobacter sp.]
MKKSAILVCSALFLATSVPVPAQQSHQEKVACDLAAQNCLNRIQIIQKRIKKLNTEIKKGSAKYSPEELKKLEDKLQETQDLLDKLEGKKAGK